MTTPAYHAEGVDESMEHIFNALKIMAIHNPADTRDRDNDDAPLDGPAASSSTASRVTGTEDALVELIKATYMHTKMLKDLQTANADLSKQLEVATTKLHQLDIKFREFRDVQAVELRPKYMLDTDKTTVDEQLIEISPSAQYYITNALVSHSNQPNITVPDYINSQGMDMSGLAATLALAPQPPDNISTASSRSSSSSFKERRHFKPHREEHVKRSRITYDSHGGQTPNISALPLNNDDGGVKEELQGNLQDTPSAQSSHGSVSSSEDSEEDGECDGPAEPSLTSWLYVKATKALFRQ